MSNSTETYSLNFNIKEILFTALNKWYILLISIVVCLSSSLIYTNFIITPLYDSMGEIYIVNRESQNISTGDISVSTYLAKDYEHLISNHAVLDEVVRRIDYKYSYTALRNGLSVENPTGTRFIEITVRTPSASDSKKIVDLICEVSQEKISELLGIERVTIVNKGAISSRPSVPNTRNNLMKALGLAVVIYAVIIFAAYFLNDKINSPEDVQKYLDINVLASIPYNQNSAKKRASSLRGIAPKP